MSSNSRHKVIDLASYTCKAGSDLLEAPRGCVVIGYEQDGGVFFGSSIADKEKIALLLDKAKSLLSNELQG
jgi:hypothetical protein